ncbi:hypothetical protein ACI65C_012046 [Semiaphis heraclei]
MIFWKRNSPLNLLVLCCSANGNYYVAVAVASRRTDNNSYNNNKITNPRLSPTNFRLLYRQRKTALKPNAYRNTRSDLFFPKNQIDSGGLNNNNN